MIEAAPILGLEHVGKVLTGLSAYSDRLCVGRLGSTQLRRE